MNKMICSTRNDKPDERNYFTMLKRPDIYYINLDCRNDRSEFMVSQIAAIQRKSPDIQGHRIQARDGLSDDFVLNEKEKGLFRNFYFPANDKMTLYNFPRIAANFLSHMKALQTFVDTSEKELGIICQDDTLFSPTFCEDLDRLLEVLQYTHTHEQKVAWSIVHLGFHKYAKFETFESVDFLKDDYNKEYENLSVPLVELNSRDQKGNTSNKCLRVLHKNVNPCSLCYLVTKRSAKDFLDYVKSRGISGPFDRVINRYCIEKEQFYGPARIMCTGSSRFQSDVWSLKIYS